MQQALARYAGVEDVAFVPADVPALDAAVAAGRTLAEAAPTVARPATALRELAGALVGVAPPAPKQRLLSRR